MKKKQALSEMKQSDLRNLIGRPAISVFSDTMSLSAILRKAYIEPVYHLTKQNADRIGIVPIYNEFSREKIVFIGEGGSGKTSAFLRLYIDADDNIKKITNTPFYYFYAPNFFSDNINNYNRKLRSIINDRSELDGILLLDGLEEAFSNDIKQANTLLRNLQNSTITFWASCRTSFYRKLDQSVQNSFAESITIGSWSSDEFNLFVDNCLQDRQDKETIRDRIKNITKKAESLLTRPLFATMILFIAQDPNPDEIHDEYELIELFLNKWIEIECKEKKVEYNKERCYEKMREIALCVYSGSDERPVYCEDITALRDLLVFSGTKKVIHRFYHREFLLFFIANALIDVALFHPDQIVKWYSQTFYDDITNLVKPVLKRLNRELSATMYANMFSVYMQSYEDGLHIKEEFEKARLTTIEDIDMSFLKLRDELLYFILKLPNVDYQSFVSYAYSHSADTMIFLGIAYGMAAIDPNNKYTLEFAQKLKPGNDEEIRNRGWGMCFFGDVDENGYTYKDDEGKPWNKIRENRLKRLADNTEKYVTRTLDLPLLFCFYCSREFNDCTSYKDYMTISNTNIMLPCFGDKQKSFMLEQKNQLTIKYLEAILLGEITRNPKAVGILPKEAVKMRPAPEKTVLEIDEQIAEQILNQIKQREIVLEKIGDFWKKDGERIVSKYKDLLDTPDHNNLSEDAFMEKLKSCRVMIISANYIEGVTVTRRLMEENHGEKLDGYALGAHWFQFASIDSIPVLHIWPSETSSFTQYGSFSAVDSALDLFQPKYVLSIGVAFGIDPQHQSMGDVLIAKDLILYDSFNKVSDGEIKLRPTDVYHIDGTFLAQVHQFSRERPTTSTDGFRWFFNAMLTGGTVLSDANEKDKLLSAAQRIGYTIIGGEMEASGIYYACKKIKGRDIPFMTIKGICDWGAEKNSWKKVANGKYDSDIIKDCVQAFACDHAFDAMRYILAQLSMD